MQKRIVGTNVKIHEKFYLKYLKTKHYPFLGSILNEENFFFKFMN